MKGTRGVFLLFWGLLAFYSVSIAAEEITAEKLGEFYPQQWEQNVLGKTAYSHLTIPGHQKASTTNYYDFGGIEIIYYEKGDSVFDKRIQKIKAPPAKIIKSSVDGCTVVIVEKKKIMADIGGEIYLSIDCYDCESNDKLMELLRAFNLVGMKELL